MANKKYIFGGVFGAISLVSLLIFSAFSKSDSKVSSKKSLGATHKSFSPATVSQKTGILPNPTTRITSSVSANSIESHDLAPTKQLKSAYEAASGDLKFKRSFDSFVTAKVYSDDSLVQVMLKEISEMSDKDAVERVGNLNKEACLYQAKWISNCKETEFNRYFASRSGMFHGYQVYVYARLCQLVLEKCVELKVATDYFSSKNGAQAFSQLRSLSGNSEVDSFLEECRKILPKLINGLNRWSIADGNRDALQKDLAAL